MTIKKFVFDKIYFFSDKINFIPDKNVVSDSETTIQRNRFLLPSNWKKYNRRDSFPFDYESNGIPSGS